jgi:hypothetical protein
MRAFAAVPVAIVCAAAPVFAAAQNHVTAARKAEKKGDWRKALTEWKAAYAADGNPEYLIGIGDAQAKLGNKAEAKKSYEAYLADPLALPANVEKVKTRIAQLEAPAAGTLALPGAAPLPLPGAAPAAAPPALAAAPAAAAAKKPDAPLPLPGLDAAPAKTASNDKAPPRPLPGRDAAPAAKKDADKTSIAAALPLPGAAAAGAAAGAAKKEPAAPAVASKEPAKPAKPIAMVAPPPEKAPEKAPIAAVTAAPVPRESQAKSGVQRTMAYVTAGVAVAALGGGVLAYSQANSAHSDLTGNVHSGAEAQRLLQNEQQNKTLAFVGLAGGLLAAGISTALFVF